MKERNATQKDLATLNAGSEGKPSLSGYRNFCVRTWELWRRGKQTNGKTGIYPVTLRPETPLYLCLQFFLVGDEKILFDCIHMQPQTAYAHVDFFLRLYRRPSRGAAAGGENQGELCTEIKPTRGQTASFIATAKAVSSENKNTQPPVPKRVPHKTGKKKQSYDLFDPFSGILY